MPRGRKQCPGCEKFVGPRTRECPDCHHRFEFKDKHKPVVQSLTETQSEEVKPPSRKKKGKKKEKECPDCGLVVAIDRAECDCSFKFASGGNEPPWDKPTPRPPKKKGAPPRIEKPFEGLTASPAEVVGTRDREALDSFIKQLQACYKHSDYSGGCYSAFLHHRHGTLRVEVWLSPDPAKAAKIEAAK